MIGNIFIFYGSFYATQENNQDFLIFFTEKSPKIKIYVSPKRLHHIVGINRLREAIEQGQSIKLAFCGHLFYSKKYGHLTFLPRTPYPADWIAILE